MRELNWMYWNVGAFYEVQGMMIPHEGSFPGFGSGDVIRMLLDMNHKTIVSVEVIVFQ